jgi:hypothetical protein
MASISATCILHPHEGRVAEVYRENEFVGYTPEPIEGARWAPWGAWVLPADHGDQTCGGL